MILGGVSEPTNTRTYMNTVYKYPLKIDDYQQVILPVGAEILCVKLVNDMPFLWALIDKEQTYDEAITIRIAGTGHDIKENVEYIDTILVEGGALVFHVFRVKN